VLGTASANMKKANMRSITVFFYNPSTIFHLATIAAR
jgi:hypothetical protein